MNHKHEHSELHQTLKQIWNQSTLDRDDETIDETLDQLLSSLVETSHLTQLSLFLNNKKVEENDYIAFKRIFETLARVINSETEIDRFNFIKSFLLTNSSDYVREMAIYSMWEMNSLECQKVLKEHLSEEKCARIIRLMQMMCDQKK